MRKSFSAISITALVAISMIPSLPAHATPDNGAAVFKGNACGFHIDTPEGYVAATGTSHYVVNHGGMTTALCNLDQTTGPKLSRTYVETGWSCGSRTLGTSNDTKAILTPSGNVTIICKFH
ncbi:hypothetical protein RXV95_14365 [Novosphingobium sp. ZN18A2]|uniref:hypothetical protein n=1 Tax=Novosphingobium sp. ZN18A2 TaxID=3079861 RepID=UPI0030CFDA67